MKKWKFILLIAGALCLFWTGSIVWCGILTDRHGDEFTDFAAMDFDYTHVWWEDTPSMRVLTYNGQEATVYFFTAGGGEKVLFSKGESGWKFHRQLAAWADGGTGDDYFIWPYFRNWVP